MRNKRIIIILILLLGTISIKLSSHKLDGVLGITSITPELNLKNVKDMLRREGVKYPDIVLRQSILESGWFKSKLSNSNNNIFGMKHPRIRETYSTGKKNGYACFDSWMDCIKDYKIFQDSFFKGTTRDQYIEWLTDNYAEDPNYIYKLKSINI